MAAAPTATAPAPLVLSPKVTTRTIKLPAATLRKPTEYGRPIRPYWVAQLVADWRDDDAGVLLVSERPDGFYLIAGNHRVRSRLAANDPHYQFDCKVYRGLTLAEEARIYLSQDNKRLRHTVADDFPAMLAEGNPTAAGVRAILASLELEIAPYGESGFKKTRIRAVSALLAAYESAGPIHLRTALELLRDEWSPDLTQLTNSKKSVYTEGSVMALSTFLRLYDPVDLPWLRKAMGREQLGGWEQRWMGHRAAAKSRPQGGIAVIYGTLAFVDLFNYGRREQNRLDELVARKAGRSLLPHHRRGVHR